MRKPCSFDASVHRRLTYVTDNNYPLQRQRCSDLAAKLDQSCSGCCSCGKPEGMTSAQRVNGLLSRLAECSSPYTRVLYSMVGFLRQ